MYNNIKQRVECGVIKIVCAPPSLLLRINSGCALLQIPGIFKILHGPSNIPYNKHDLNPFLVSTKKCSNNKSYMLILVF